MKNKSTMQYLVRALVSMALTATTLSMCTGAQASPPRAGISVPRDVVAVAMPGSIDVTWVAPASNGGHPIDGYCVEVVSPAYAAGGECAQSTVTALVYAPAPPSIAPALVPGVVYTFRVSATTRTGWGAYSAPSNRVMALAYSTTPAPTPVVPAASAVSLVTQNV